jgi:hypothetical protein
VTVTVRITLTKNASVFRRVLNVQRSNMIGCAKVAVGSLTKSGPKTAKNHQSHGHTSSKQFEEAKSVRRVAARRFYAFYAFYAWWDYFPQSGALAEGGAPARGSTL